MLRRATTGLLHHQCRSHHPLSRPGNYRNPSVLSSTIPDVEDDAFAERKKKNSTTQALSDAGRDGARASVSDNDATSTTRRVRTRSLRPIPMLASFPSGRLPPSVESIPETSSSSDQNTDTVPSSTFPSTTTITLIDLPPSTVKADILPIFQRFGEVTRIFVQLDGRRADVVFADVHGVKRTLHAYAEEPLCVRGREIIVSRKYMEMNKVSGMDTDMDTPSSVTRTERGRDDGGIFVSNFPPTMMQEELLEALELFGKYEQFVMGPRSKLAYFTYSSEDCVEDILSVHRRTPITVRGRILHIERAEKRPYSSTSSSEDTLEVEESLDLVTSSTILKELTRTVSRFKGSHDPSQVLWIGGLPRCVSRTALTNFWSRLGCVVDVRPSSKGGYAHVEFVNTEEALRAVRQGAPHGFRYRQRLLDIDFAPSISPVGPVYRGVYISGWPASYHRSALLKWTYDISNIAEATVLPAFRGEKRSNPRSAFLQFGTIDDARAALRMLDGRMGPGGETLHVGLSRLPAVHPIQMWRWVQEVVDMKRSGGGEVGEACLEDKWEGLGFGTGEEEQDDTSGVEH